MGKITALTRQKRNPDRINVYLDGTFAFGLAAISAVPLRVGQLLTQTEIDSLKGADLEEKAKEVALRFIEYRPRSTAETRQHLLKKEYPEDVVERVIERLTAVELLNDAAFANYWVEQRQTFKPRTQLASQPYLRAGNPASLRRRRPRRRRARSLQPPSDRASGAHRYAPAGPVAVR